MKGTLIFGLCILLLGFVKMNRAEGEKMDGVMGNLAQEAPGCGIVFFNTTRLEKLKDFYIHRVGCKLWLDQGSCAILKYGNLLVGFCDGETGETDAVLTFFYKNPADVDFQYHKFKSIAVAAPKENKKYRIYHFYARDPEGRSIEFQCFLNPIDWDFGQFKEKAERR
jgi:hypothetical protein